MGDNSGSSGALVNFVSQVEVREVVIAEGVQFHESDAVAHNNVLKQYSDMLDANPGSFRTDPVLRRLAANTSGSDQQRARQIQRIIARSKEYTDILFLEEKLAPDFKVSADRMTAEYMSNAQSVQYKFRLVNTQADFKKALETQGLIVVYDGHARYGRGPCFDQYSGASSESGNQWEEGTHDNNGIFRMGFPFVPVELEDMEHHQYAFRPIPVESPKPPSENQHPFSRHPEARRTLVPIQVKQVIADHVKQGYTSPSGQYWGYGSHLVLNAGWDGTARPKYNLDDVDLQCRTFCHFGCSSRVHCWELIRRAEYKAWSRPRPPTDRLAYFTTATSDWRTAYWIFYLLSYNRPNSATHFFDSHEYAVRRGNQRLAAEGAGFQLY